MARLPPGRQPIRFFGEPIRNPDFAMAVTLDQILALAGRLDDTPGFDTPRERFRRFLREHVTSFDALRLLIAQGRHVPGEQHRRALQDLVAEVGRYLGFGVTFGTLSAEGTADHQGVWTAGQLSIVLAVRHAPTARETLAALVATMSSLPESPLGLTRPLGLVVVTPHGNGRQKLDEAREALGTRVNVTVLGLDTVLSLADLVVAGHVTDRDAARLFRTDAPVDFVADLVGRAARHPPEPAPTASVERANPAPAPAEAPAAPSYWLVGVVPDQAMSPDAFLELVVLRRQVFGVGETMPAAGPIRAGDSVCFYITGRGVVGRASVTSIMEDGGGIRDARRFRQILRLADLTLHVDRPAALEPESDLRLKTIRPIGKRPVQTLLKLSHERYVAMATPAAHPDVAPPAQAAETA